MGSEATRLALEDCGLNYKSIQQAFVGYVFGDSTSGPAGIIPCGYDWYSNYKCQQQLFYRFHSFVFSASAIESGSADCVLALGFEQMRPGALGDIYTDRPSPFGEFNDTCEQLVGNAHIPLALRYFGGAGKSHMEKFASQKILQRLGLRRVGMLLKTL